MTDELPKCRLCGAAPLYHVGPDTWCDTLTCRLYRLPMTVGQWRLLHGPRLAPEYVSALRALREECVRGGMYYRALTAVLGEVVT